jgi:hypothetical protein
MTRTKPSYLVVLVAIGAAVGWLVQGALVAMGGHAIVPPVTLAAALGLIGGLVVVLAVPVFRVVRGTAKERVDPFYATRVVVLAKASSLTGSALSGAALAILVFLLTRSVVPGATSISMAIATLVGAVLLLIGGLVAEKMCTLPPDDDADDVAPGELPTR